MLFWCPRHAVLMIPVSWPHVLAACTASRGSTGTLHPSSDSRSGQAPYLAYRSVAGTLQMNLGGILPGLPYKQPE